MNARVNRIQGLIEGGHVKATDPGASHIQVWDKAAGALLERVREVNVAEGWADITALDEHGRMFVVNDEVQRRRVYGDFELRRIGKGGPRHG